METHRLPDVSTEKGWSDPASQRTEKWSPPSCEGPSLGGRRLKVPPFLFRKTCYNTQVSGQGPHRLNALRKMNYCTEAAGQTNLICMELSSKEENYCTEAARQINRICMYLSDKGEVWAQESKVIANDLDRCYQEAGDNDIPWMGMILENANWLWSMFVKHNGDAKAYLADEDW